MEVAEEVFSCYADRVWIWKHGHIDKRKFKGSILSGHPHSFDGEYEIEDIIKAKVVHGWVIAIAGDLSGCGYDESTWFGITEPKIVDGRWDFAGLEDPVAEKIVIDGPHKATWLEIG